MVGQLVANLGSMLKGLGNVMVWKHQSKPEQNIKANQEQTHWPDRTPANAS